MHDRRAMLAPCRAAGLAPFAQVATVQREPPSLHLPHILRMRAHDPAEFGAGAVCRRGRIEGALKDKTTASWTPAPGGMATRVWWLDTSAARWLFGVQSVSSDGWASPIEFTGAAGAFVSP